jgi:uncharacterized protein
LIGHLLAVILLLLIDALVGLVIGAICVMLFEAVNKITPKKH